MLGAGPDIATQAEQACASGAFAQAAALASKALPRSTGVAQARLLSALAAAQCGMGDHAEARKSIQKAIKIAPKAPELHCRHAHILAESERLDESVEAWRRALDLTPKHPWALRGLSETLVRRGDAEEAADTLEAAMGDGPTAPVDLVLAYLRVAQRVGRADRAIAIGEALLRAGAKLPEGVRATALWSMGTLYDSKGRRDEAFAAWTEANRFKAVGFDPAPHAQAIDETIAAWTPAAFQALPKVARKTSGIVFIVGMMRSGTSLVEQIIASHPEAFGAGELPYINNIAGQIAGTRDGWAYVRHPDRLTIETLDSAAKVYTDTLRKMAPGARLITDKMPHNFLHLGLIAAMLPGARVIHCVRDPRDACLSCFTYDFKGRGNTYAYRLDWLGDFFASYWRLMAHWRRTLPIPMLDVVYEDLTAAPDEGIRRIVEFCGLSWDDRCLRFHETKRDVRTLSREQVKRPMYRSSAGRWKAYEKHLGPLIERLPPDSLRPD